ncbi:MAG: gliding motility-associated C-terminal domain-containing protein [Bacteroidota bacterium]
MKLKNILLPLSFIFLTLPVFSQLFTGGLQDGYISGTSPTGVMGADSLVTHSPTNASYCEGDTLTIAYTCGIVFNAGNIFTIQLSDATGSFAAPTDLGTVIGTTSGSLQVMIPMGTPVGAAYRFRVTATDPIRIGIDNGVDIAIYSKPIVTFSSFIDTCINIAPFALWGGDPVGGTYFGTGVSAGNFDPAIAGEGTHILSYTYTNVNGCSDTATWSVIVDTVGVSLNTFIDTCADVTPFAMFGGSPVGGTYEGPGITAGTFDPAAAGLGVHTISYIWMNLDGCSDTATTTVTVNGPSVVTFVSFFDTCVNVLPFALTGGNPVGGVYSGPGVAGGIFDPLVAGVGTHTLTYTYTNPFNCTSSATFDVLVNPLPVVELNTFDDTCSGTEPFVMFGGTPLGGIYSGTGIYGNVFFPDSAGAGNFLITYTYTDADGCPNSDTMTVTVLATPVVEISAFIDTCINIAPFALTGGTPAGGTYSGDGVAAGNFDPIAAGVGSHIIYYEFTDVNGCDGIDSTVVTVSDTPVVTLSTFIDTCMGITPFQLTGGLPLGGIYSGTGVYGNFFFPDSSGAGSFVITYTYSNGEGCVSIDTQTVVVYPVPVVTLVLFADTCIDIPAFALTGGLPVGGVYSGTGVAAGNFDPAIAGAGSHIITYTYTDAINGCTASATDTVVVDPLPVALAGTDTAVCFGNSYQINASGGATYLWSPVAGLDNPAIANPITTPTATTTYTVTVTSAQGCSSTDNIVIIVHPLPIANAGVDISVCPGIDTVLNGSGGVNYVWSPGFGLSAINIPNPIAAPTTTTTYVLTVYDVYGCSAQDSMILTVFPQPIANAGLDVTICYGDSTQLTGSGGLEYLWLPPTGISNDTIANPWASPGFTIIYYLTVTDANGCLATDNVQVNVNPLPDVYITSSITGTNNVNWTYIYTGTTVTFDAGPPGYATYNFMVDNVSVQNTSSNIYVTNSLQNGQVVSVEVSENGCTNSYAMKPIVVKPLPNAFTPNGDGKNDLFARGLMVRVFNRYGQKLYEGNEGWDGTFEGRKVAPDTYYYVVTLFDLDNNETVIKGTIAVIDKD